MAPELGDTSAGIQFIESHQPALDAGDYTITLEPEVKRGTEVLLNASAKSNVRIEQRFSVSGPRFSLDPQQVEAVFPPAGSIGEHSSVLPHIILMRSTLPWERSANGKKDSPWLALLLFDEHDRPPEILEQIRVPASIKLGVLSELSGSNPFEVKQLNPNDQGQTKYTCSFPAFGRPPESHLRWESGDHEDDATAVIDVPRELLADIAPSAEDLKLLAHVRQSADLKNHQPGVERAVIICNRLPRKGCTSIVHLVSVEGRYGTEGFEYNPKADRVRLVSLYSWRFACASEEHSLEKTLMKLKPGTVRLPELKGDTPAAKAAKPYLDRGCVPLPHRMRQGNRSVSWYHGPLIPGAQAGSVQLPVRMADDLVLYNPETGLFDVSYSAAWQLGRLLTLQNRRVSVDLFNWKRSHAQSLSDVELKLTHLHFAALTPLNFPESVRTWFEDMRLLKGMPFNYLVPDKAMLPIESIRFFQVDPLWVDCLRDGAFSIGRVFDADKQRDVKLHAEHIAQAPQGKSGFLLRSDVVAGWPGLQVDGYADIGGKMRLTLDRMDRLSKNILFCVFDGAIKAVDFHLKPEALHNEFTAAENERWTKRKRVRKDGGGWIEAEPVDVPLKTSRNISHPMGIVEIEKLADRLNGRSSAALAVQMVSSTKRIRFSLRCPDEMNQDAGK